MKKRNHNILIYDDYCPLCSWYSGLFVKYGFLSANGRKAFSVLEPEILSKIDFQKGKNEIPLMDPATGKVLYGIDALLEILNTKIPFIKSIGNLRPVKWFLKKLYKLISYNRKVIVAQKCNTGIIDCAPDFNYIYRFLFMAICLVFNSIMLVPFHNLILSKLSYYHPTNLQFQIAHLSFVAVNCLLSAICFSKPKAFEFLGQVNMLALTVILLLIPLMLIHKIGFNQLLTTVYLVATTLFIFKEYKRRMSYAGIIPKNKWMIGFNFLCLAGFLAFLFH